MRSEDIAVSVRNVTKTYRLFAHPGDRIKQFLSFGIRRYHQSFNALSDVSLDIRKGETVGIIGPNGSGKSTLLQIICGILKPTSGTVQVNGRVSALLELGAGFNPEFTGRENVYFQGMLMGLGADVIDRRFGDIADFAGIGEFIDQPVRTYSSGMFLRLAFSVAVHVDPDILVVDEALAVGDPLFQKRCYARIKEMQQRGLTLVFVSHDHEIVRTLTSMTLLLGSGVSLYWGDSREATHRYRKILFEEEALRIAREHNGDDRSVMSGKPATSGEYGIGGATITGLRILAEGGEERSVFQPGERIHLEVSFSIDTPLDKLNVSVVIKTLQGWKLYSWGTLNQDIAIWAGRLDGEVFWDKTFEASDKPVVNLALDGNFGAGSYEVQAVVSREMDRHFGSQQVLHWCDEIGTFRVEMNKREYFFGGICDLHGRATFDA